jgi:hypothetical protein
MNKGYKMSKVFKPVNNNEKLLFSVPTDCNCSACQDTRKYLKEEIGEKRYEQICKELAK